MTNAATSERGRQRLARAMTRLLRASAPRPGIPAAGAPRELTGERRAKTLDAANGERSEARARGTRRDRRRSATCPSRASRSSARPRPLRNPSSRRTFSFNASGTIGASRSKRRTRIAVGCTSPMPCIRRACLIRATACDARIAVTGVGDSERGRAVDVLVAVDVGHGRAAARTPRRSENRRRGR